MAGIKRVVAMVVALLVVSSLVGMTTVAHAQEDSGTGSTIGEESFSVQSVMQDMKRKFKAGGLTMWFLLFLSVLSLAFILERAFRLRRRAIAPAGVAGKAAALWEEKKYDDILALCDQHEKSTLSKIIRLILKHRHTSLADVTNVAGDIASRDIGHHQMLTYPLAAIGALAPLLGLFGTVLGMIESFETVAIAGSMGDPSLLASGISKALVTTAFGLFVAIPTLFFYNVYRFRTNFLSKLLEEEASGLVSEWLMEEEGQSQ